MNKWKKGQNIKNKQSHGIAPWFYMRVPRRMNEYDWEVKMVVVANSAEITAPRSDSWSQHWRLITVFAARLLAWRIPCVIIDPGTSDFSEVPVSATPLLWRNLLHAKNDDIRYRPPLPTSMRSLDLQTGAALSLACEESRYEREYMMVVIRVTKHTS